MKKKHDISRKIKNFVLAGIIALSMLLGANMNLAFGAVNFVRDMARAEYKPADTVTPYEFTSSSGWNQDTNAPSNSDLSQAFSTSRMSADLFNLEDYSLKPSVNYKGEELVLDEEQKRNTTTDNDNVMIIQAVGAPKKVEVDKKDKRGNAVYSKDADGNFLFEPKIYQEADVEADAENRADYVVVDPDAEVKTYKKKLKDTEGNYKVDSKGAFIFEAEVYSSNEGNESLYVQIEDTGTYNKKIPEKEMGDSYFGYKTTSSITMRAGCYYVFVLWVWTSGTDACFTISNSSSDYIETVKISNTNETWKRVYLFVEAASDSSTSVNMGIYLGLNDKLTESDENPDALVNGAVYVHNVIIKTISESDFRKKIITGDENPEGAVTDIQSCEFPLRHNEDIAFLGPDFQTEDIKVYEKMFGEEGYTALKDQADNINQFERYVSRYSDDNATNERSDNQLANVRRAYRDKFTYTTVLEKTEFMLDDLDAEGNPKTDENGDVIKKDGYNTFTGLDAEGNEIDNRILKLENSSEAFELGLMSAPISVKQFGYYRLSLFVKAKTADDDVTVKLVSSIKTANSVEYGAQQIKSQSISAYTENSDTTNDWAELVFYIQGSCYYDMTMQLVILAGTESTIYVDNLRYENITSETYRNQASAKRFDLAPSSTVYSSSIENGYFNSVSTDKVDPEKLTIPYTPYGWTKLDNSSKYAVSGIVSTSDAFYTSPFINDEDKGQISVQQKLGGAENPVSTYTVGETNVELPRTNVLAIYSPLKEDMDAEDVNQLDKDFKGHYYGYKSSQFSLSSNSVYEITFEVFTSETAQFNGQIFANLIYADEHIAEFTTNVADTRRDIGWQTYTIVIRTGSSSRTFSLELGVKDAFGTVFFQNVKYKQLQEKTDPTDSEKKITADIQYAERLEAYPTMKLQKDNKIKFIDYDGDNAIMASEEKVKDGDDTLDYYSSLSYTLRTGDEDEEIVQGALGVIDTSEAFRLSADLHWDADELANPKVSNKNVMMLYNDQTYYTAVNPNFNTSLSSSSYYQITVWVRTIGVPEGSGLTITINNTNVKFEQINTENDFDDLTDSNGYKAYTALIRTGSSSLSGVRMSFELGTEKHGTTGVALISGIDYKKLETEDEYNELVEAVDENDKTTVVKNFYVESTDTAENDANNATLATFFLVFSSLLLVAALVFAMIAVYVKRIPKRAKVDTTGSGNGGTSVDTTPKDGFV